MTGRSETAASLHSDYRLPNSDFRRSASSARASLHARRLAHFKAAAARAVPADVPPRHLSADQVGAGTNVENAVSGGCLRTAIEPDAVIRDFNHQVAAGVTFSSFGSDAHPDLPGPRVTADVVDRFLDDAVKLNAFDFAQGQPVFQLAFANKFPGELLFGGQVRDGIVAAAQRGSLYRSCGDVVAGLPS